MNTGAGVRSLEVLKDWYSSLAQFRGDAQNAMISLSMALQHARDWLEEQQDYWRRAIRKAEEEVTHAKMELRNRQQQKFLGERPDTTVQEKALRRAQAELEFAEERLAAVRRWVQKLPSAIQDTYEGPSRNLEFFLDADLPRALALLDRQLGSLEQYLALKPEAPAGCSPDNTSDRIATEEGAVMRLDTGRGILHEALQTLQAHWDETSPYWQDAMRIQFVEQVWEPLQKQVASALEAIDQMQVLLNQMRHECEDDGGNI